MNSGVTVEGNERDERARRIAERLRGAMVGGRDIAAIAGAAAGALGSDAVKAARDSLLPERKMNPPPQASRGELSIDFGSLDPQHALRLLESLRDQWDVRLVLTPRSER